MERILMSETPNIDATPRQLKGGGGRPEQQRSIDDEPPEDRAWRRPTPRRRKKAAPGKYLGTRNQKKVAGAGKSL